jgi:hypothetical protein
MAPRAPTEKEEEEEEPNRAFGPAWKAVWAPARACGSSPPDSATKADRSEELRGVARPGAGAALKTEGAREGAAFDSPSPRHDRSVLFEPRA